MNARAPGEPATAASPLPEAALPLDMLDRVATGVCSDEDVQFLARSQLSITRALLAAVAGRGGGMTSQGWDLLNDLERVAPQAVRAVMAHPYLRVWAAACLGQPDGSHDQRRAYLSCVAAAAALRSGASTELALPVAQGRVHLPTVGTIVLPTPMSGDVKVSISSGELAIWSETAGHGWYPAHLVELDGLTILLDDLDPHRDCHGWPVTGQLSPAEVVDWMSSLGQAWRVIEVDAPAQVPAMRAALRVVAPLAADPAGQMRSSTSRHAFGAIGSVRADPAALAVMLVHEFQHSVLGAVLDLCDLFDPTYLPMLKVAWRTDPRPIEGVLQGAYAHLAITSIWRARAHHPAPGRDDAEEQFRRNRDNTWAAIEAMRASGALTSSGTRFVDRMARTLSQWS